MGIYYYAIDDTVKEYIEPPENFSNKFPGVCHPKNIFPQIVVMANCQGRFFYIVNDSAHEIPNDYKDMTEYYYQKYLEKFTWAKEFYEKDEYNCTCHIGRNLRAENEQKIQN